MAQLTALTVHTAYAAFLISFLTVQKFSFPFNSLRELIDIGSYRLGVLANSAHIDDFKVSHVILDQFWKPFLIHVPENDSEISVVRSVLSCLVHLT
jgi:hypothetical protein